MATFEVDEVERGTLLYPKVAVLPILTYKIKVKPESFSKYPDYLNPVDVRYVSNSFVGAVHTAYYKHYPLVLSPDMIWQCVAQGLPSMSTRMQRNCVTCLWHMKGKRKSR